MSINAFISMTKCPKLKKEAEVPFLIKWENIGKTKGQYLDTEG